MDAALGPVVPSRMTGIAPGLGGETTRGAFWDDRRSFRIGRGDDPCCQKGRVYGGGEGEEEVCQCAGAEVCVNLKISCMVSIVAYIGLPFIFWMIWFSKISTSL